jgi:IS1 family transposase
MNVLSRDQQIQVIGALTEGMSIRSVERMTGIHRDTIMRLGAKVGRGCAVLHDRMMVGLRVGRIECDELWAFVGKKQKHMKRTDSAAAKGDQWTFVGLASTSRAIIAYRTGKRDSDSAHEFMADLRERVLGSPEISTDGFTPYQPAVRDQFKNSAHGVITKTYSVTNLGGKGAHHRYSPAAVVACERESVQGVAEDISTSYVERSNLSIRMSNRRFTRLTNGFSKKLDNHCAAVSLYVAHYNLCRVHETLRTTPAVQLGITDRAWSLGELIDAALATQPTDPVVTAPQRRKAFTVIQGGKSN